MSSLSRSTSPSSNQMGNGEWLVHLSKSQHSQSSHILVPTQTHEVIGSPPNVAVPTHFAKVVLASKPSSPATPDIPEISTGAFVLPNAVIPDDTPLTSFVVPGEFLFFME